MVVNLWATWCGPCRLEIPELVKLHKEFHSRGVEIVGLSTENPDASAEKVRKFIQDFQIDYRIGWAPAEVGAPLMQGHEAIPQSYVISRDGWILKHFVGFSPANTPAQLRQAIEEALN
jgi:peroxiredoxin